MKLLFIRLSSLGDIVLTTGLFPWIKSHLPQAEIHFVTKETFAPLLNDCPEINKVHTINGKESLKELHQTLGQFDFVFDLHDNLRSKIIAHGQGSKSYKYSKSSLKRRLYTQWRLGKNSLDSRSIPIKYAEPITQALSLPSPDPQKLRPYLASNSNKKLDCKNPIAIHPFASKGTKEWPYIQELCELLISQDFTPVVIGRSHHLLDLPKKTVSLVNKTSLPGMIETIRSSLALVSTDSGPMHLGVAVKTPVIALFGSTTEDFGFSPSIYSQCKVLQNNSLSCRPCHVHGLAHCPKSHFKCMKDIKAKQVFSELQALLSKS